MTEQNYRNHNENSPTLSDLVRKEQDYRHKWQDKFLKSHILSFRLGQFFGFVYNIALLYITYDLIKSGEKKLAVIIFASNIMLIVFALIVTKIERKIINRKPPRKNRDERRFKRQFRAKN